MANKTILITGGCFGLGRTITDFFIKENHTVIVLDREKNELDNLGKHKNVIPYHVDLTNFDELVKTTELILKDFEIDILINNAASQYIETIEELDFDHWDEIQTSNLKSPMYLMKAIGSSMKPKSKILNITSVHGSLPRNNKYSYDASKAALNLMTKEVALAYSDKGILVNAISLGATNTKMNQYFKDKEALKNTTKKIPLNRVCEPKELIPLVKYILFDDNYSTGSIFTIDGGRSLT